jgi:hypothetical protein
LALICLRQLKRCGALEVSSSEGGAMQLSVDDRDIILAALYHFSMLPEMRDKPEGVKAGELFLELDGAKEFHFLEPA